MKILSRRNGFSLIELLTVIAIIAILAAIIFPVMSTVKDRARQSECMSNMHQIAMAAQMFKQDNRKFPDVLASKVVVASGNTQIIWDGSNGTPLPFEDAKVGEGLFPEYSKSSTKLFHCSTSKITSTSDVVRDIVIPTATGNKKVNTYAYDTYSNYLLPNGSYEQRYNVAWAYATSAYDAIDAVANSRCQPYDGNESTEKQQADYERQLRFRNPPGDTVLTWCSNHETRTGNTVSGNVLIVFLDGHTEIQPAATVENCKWRTRPKK